MGKRSCLDILIEKRTSITHAIFLLPPVVYGRMPERCRSPDCQVGHDVPAPALLAAGCPR